MPQTTAPPEATTTGTAGFRGWSTWYRVTGDLQATLDAGLAPLVVLHGGPGATHDYTLSIAAFSDLGPSRRAVVHYDQLGCGRSTHLPDADPGTWTVQLFLDELDNLLDHLGIAHRYAVLGQSWGGMLGAEHAIRRPAGLTCLVIADSPASMELWVSEADRLRADLPSEVQATLLRHEEAGTTGSEEYRAAEEVFYARHVCRIVPNPPEVAASFAAIDEDPTVYHTMNGPSEFHVVGSLRRWSVVDEVHAIEVPTLVVTGAHDEATPATVKPFLDAVPDVRWEVFADSSHMPHVEEAERYASVVTAFLDANDPAPQPPAPSDPPTRTTPENGSVTA